MASYIQKFVKIVSTVTKNDAVIQIHADGPHIRSTKLLEVERRVTGGLKEKLQRLCGALPLLGTEHFERFLEVLGSLKRYQVDL